MTPRRRRQGFAKNTVRVLGPGDAEGSVTIGWNATYDTFFELDFGDYTATIFWNESRGKWEFFITQGELQYKVYSVTLFADKDGNQQPRALDAGTTELMSWFLTEAVS